jgi:hypothetical protein
MSNERRPTVKLDFMHPSRNEWFEAEVDPSITAQDTLLGLQQAGFLEVPKDGDYHLILVRSGKEVVKQAPFNSFGVQPDDKFAVVYRMRGASAKRLTEKGSDPFSNCL